VGGNQSCRAKPVQRRRHRRRAVDHLKIAEPLACERRRDACVVSREPMSDLVPSYNDASAPFDTGGGWAAYQSALRTCRTVAPTASAKYPKYSPQVKPSSSLTFRTDPTTRSAGASSARRMASATWKVEVLGYRPATNYRETYGARSSSGHNLTGLRRPSAYHFELAAPKPEAPTAEGEGGRLWGSASACTVQRKALPHIRLRSAVVNDGRREGFSGPDPA
jgi:hypothetical protein